MAQTKGQQKDYRVAARRYNKAHPEVHRKASRKYRKTHPIKNRESSRLSVQKWRALHPDAARQNNCKNQTKMYARHCYLVRRAKKLLKRGVQGSMLTLDQHAQKIYNAEGQKRPCRYCGHKTGDTGSGLDRKKSTINYTMANTVPACLGCNVWKNVNRSYKVTMTHFKPMRDTATLK